MSKRGISFNEGWAGYDVGMYAIYTWCDRNFSAVLPTPKNASPEAEQVGPLAGQSDRTILWGTIEAVGAGAERLQGGATVRCTASGLTTDDQTDGIGVV